MEPFLQTHGFGQLVAEKELKRSDRSRVLLLRDRGSGLRYIYREYTGSGDVYEKLQSLHCPHLPEIPAVSRTNDRVQVLEEFVPGDTLAFVLEGGPLLPETEKCIAVNADMRYASAAELIAALSAPRRRTKRRPLFLSTGLLAAATLLFIFRPEGPFPAPAPTTSPRIQAHKKQDVL